MALATHGRSLRHIPHQLPSDALRNRQRIGQWHLRRTAGKGGPGRSGHGRSWGEWSRGKRTDRADRAHSPSKVLGPTEQLVGRHDPLGSHLIRERLTVANLARHQILADEIQRRDLIPRSGDRLHDGERFKAVFHQTNLSAPVIGEITRDGRDPDFVIVHIDQRTRRIAANHHPTLNTPDLAHAEHDHYQRPQRSKPRPKRTSKNGSKHGKTPTAGRKRGRSIVAKPSEA